MWQVENKTETGAQEYAYVLEAILTILTMLPWEGSLKLWHLSKDLKKVGCSWFPGTGSGKLLDPAAGKCIPSTSCWFFWTFNDYLTNLFFSSPEITLFAYNMVSTFFNDYKTSFLWISCSLYLPFFFTFACDVVLDQFMNNWSKFVNNPYVIHVFVSAHLILAVVYPYDLFLLLTCLFSVLESASPMSLDLPILSWQRLRKWECILIKKMHFAFNLCTPKKFHIIWHQLAHLKLLC